MWKNINDISELENFMNMVCNFHDSCIKEIKYLSGSYVDEALDMYPINDCRILNMIIQRQFEDYPVIEMEFSGLKFLKLFPANEKYTSEIYEATLMYKNGFIYWYDCGVLSDEELDRYEGAVICASRLRWRPLEGCLGQKILCSLPQQSQKYDDGL